MKREELTAIFDQQAVGYDKRQEKMAPILNGLRFLLEPLFADVPVEAQILCVGVGTGAELSYLAQKFPQWSFTTVEPSGPMLDICRHKAEEEGFASRCFFHEGYIESLPGNMLHDAATCFLVFQFILEPEARSNFFRRIADRLKPGGILVSSDLSQGASPDDYEALLAAWFRMTTTTDASPEGIARMRATYSRDVAVLPAPNVASIIQAGGFDAPVQFFQAGLMHAWFSKRASDSYEHVHQIG